MRILKLGILILSALPAITGVEEWVSAGTTDHQQASTANRNTVLVDTRVGVDPPAFSVISSAFTDPVLEGFQTAGADDFTVPDCGWSIHTIRAFGRYSNTINPTGQMGPASSLRLYILPKTAATPTSTDLASLAIYANENLTYTELDQVEGGDFEIALPNIVLAKGDYWLVVQANLELLAVGQWNWTESSLTPNSGTTTGDESAWYQNLAGVLSPATGMVECVGSWGSREAGCSMTRSPDSNPPTDRDFAFQIEGTVLPAAITVTPTVLNTVENGSAVTYTVVLDAPPCAGEIVTITPTSTNTDEGTVTGVLNFDESNWATPVAVTVTPGSSGDGNDGDLLFAINHQIASNQPTGCYPLIAADSVSITNQNIDGIATILVDPAASLQVDEAGTSTRTVTVSAATGMFVPTSDVTLNLTTDSTDIALSTQLLTLNLANSYTATFNVSGVLDDVVEDTENFTITTAAAVSADPAYNGVNPVDVSGTVTDSNTATVTVTPNQTPLQTSEAGATDSLDYVLTAQPTAEVSFGVGSDDPGEATSQPSSLTFSSENWNIPQTVTVTGTDDDIDDELQGFNIVGTPTSSLDAHWVGINVNAVPGENSDDADTGGMIADGGNGVETSETGTIDFFTVELRTEPLFPVSLGVRSGDTSEGLLSSGGGIPGEMVTLTFHNGNWSIPQTVTVTGVDDGIDDGDVTYTLYTDASLSADPVYSGLDLPDFSATNIDNDLSTTFFTALPNWPGYNLLQLTELINNLTPLTAQLAQVAATSSLEIGPLPGFTSQWITAPQATRIPLGTVAQLRLATNQANHLRHQWQGVTIVKQNAGTSLVEVIFDQLGTTTVSVSLVAGLLTRKLADMQFEVVAIDPSEIRYNIQQLGVKTNLIATSSPGGFEPLIEWRKEGKVAQHGAKLQLASQRSVSEEITAGNQFWHDTLLMPVNN